MGKMDILKAMELEPALCNDDFPQEAAGAKEQLEGRNDRSQGRLRSRKG
jgi:hypothetical protein